MSKTLEQHNYHGIDATIIADSKNEHGQRITSFVCTFPRIVLAEFNTHRMLSRNSASSRAIPFQTKVQKMFGDKVTVFTPTRWQKDHSGMQGDEYFTSEESIELEKKWLDLGFMLKEYAEWFSEKGVTKQICNRILELHSYQTVICTATEWENFFALRADEAAEIHIQKLAHIMLDEYNDSEPEQLKAGEWHIPFGDQFDSSRLDKMYMTLDDTSKFYFEESGKPDVDDYNAEMRALKVAIATARCARVSYENFEGGDDYEKDIKLHDRLASMGHWSPFEHCAKAMNSIEMNEHFRGEAFEVYDADLVTDNTVIINGSFPDSGFGWSGNFQGFVQYRKMFQGENKTDNRVKS